MGNPEDWSRVITRKGKAKATQNSQVSNNNRENIDSQNQFLALDLALEVIHEEDRINNGASGGDNQNKEKLTQNQNIIAEENCDASSGNADLLRKQHVPSD